MASKRISIGSSLLTQSSLHQQVKRGLGAFKAKDLRLIADEERRQVYDSLDLDDAARDAYPNDHRWDYIISVARGSQLVGLEPHSARDGEVSAVIQKKNNAARFLRDHLQQHQKIGKWLWVSHGSVGFSSMDRSRRILDQHGITFVGRIVRKF